MLKFHESKLNDIAKKNGIQFTNEGGQSQNDKEIDNAEEAIRLQTNILIVRKAEVNSSKIIVNEIQ